MTHYQRHLSSQIIEGLSSAPAIFVGGPRQAGKSTLVEEIVKSNYPAEYYTLDNVATYGSIARDPEGFLEQFDQPIVIDEVQLLPQLYRALKKRIDELRLDRKAKIHGRFILTGSASISVFPELADALVGRIFLYTLYPLSVGEVIGREEKFLETVFSSTKHLPKIKPQPLSLVNLIKKATYPELANTKESLRARWIDSYLNTLAQRDVKAITEVEKIAQIPLVIEMLASRVSGLLNDASLSRELGLNHSTLRRYRVLLNQIFLTLEIEPWFRNIGKRLVKAPKLFFTDTSVLCHLLNADPKELGTLTPNLKGKIIENFVASELTKQISKDNFGKLYHFRSHEGDEVDFVIEQRGGKIVGVEVKAKTSVTHDDFKGLETLEKAAGANFVRGIVLYQGDQITPFGSKFHLLPLSTLWSY